MYIFIKKIFTSFLIVMFLTMTGCTTFQRRDAATGSFEMSDATEYGLKGAVGGAVVGAGLGAVGGAIGGNAGKGAAIGAVTGIVIGGLAGIYMGYKSDQLEEALRNQLLGTGIQVGQTESGKVFLIMANAITFNTNSYTVKPSLAAAFDAIRIVLNMEEYQHLSLGVYGFTDDRGTDKYNGKLSYNRAVAVAMALQNAGVINVITPHGMGEIKSGNDTEMGRAQNRKVEVVFENQ